MNETKEENDQPMIQGLNEFMGGVTMLFVSLGCAIAFGNLIATLDPMGMSLAGLMFLFLVLLPAGGTSFLATGIVKFRSSANK